MSQEIDTGIDETKIPEKVSGYPNPAPHDHSSEVIPRGYHFYKDDNFNYAIDDVDLLTTEIADEVDYDIKAKNSRVKPTISFDDIDDHARKGGSHLLDSFQDLIQYLTEPLGSDKHPKTKTARAIVVWLGQQNLDGKTYGTKGLDTPRGLIQYLKEEKMTYTTCYTILCRKAGLQCVPIKGHVKAARYEPGDDDVPESSWCAVFVEFGWQIVHPFWVCRAIFGNDLGGWVKVEKNGKSVKEKESSSSGIQRNIFTESYFMPNPEGFIYKCCASEKEWQLVNPRSVVSSVKEFMEKAYLFPPFFGIGFTLVSEPKCVLNSKDGFCKVEMKARSANAHMIVLRYELFRKEHDVDSYATQNEENEVARMVFNSRAGEMFTFDIRFPKTGIYKLVIYGGPYKSPALRLCEFKIICNQEMVGRDLLPIDCEDIGWGPSPVSVEAGLLMPSKPNGLIPINDKEKKTEVKFQLRDIGDNYSAVVHGEVGGRRKQIEDNNVEIMKERHLHQIIISVTIPDKGEYGLSIQHIEAKSRDKHGKNVCNYLISTLAYKSDRANVKIAKKKLNDAVAANVEPRMLKQQISEIHHCVEKCKKEKVPDNDDDIIAANEMVWFLTWKDKLRDCVLRRNLHVTRNTLALVSQYKNQDALTKEVKNVKALEKDLVALRDFARQVPKLEEASKEITALKHAPAEVHNTFKALLVLLGDTEHDLEEWSDIQTRMKASSHTAETSVLNKMKHIQGEQISKDRLKEAVNILHKYKEDQVRKVNSDAHSFYTWIEDVISVHEGK